MTVKLNIFRTKRKTKKYFFNEFIKKKNLIFKSNLFQVT